MAVGTTDEREIRRALIGAWKASRYGRKSDRKREPREPTPAELDRFIRSGAAGLSRAGLGHNMVRTVEREVQVRDAARRGARMPRRGAIGRDSGGRFAPTETGPEARQLDRKDRQVYAAEVARITGGAVVQGRAGALVRFEGKGRAFNPVGRSRPELYRAAVDAAIARGDSRAAVGSEARRGYEALRRRMQRASGSTPAQAASRAERVGRSAYAKEAADYGRQGGEKGQQAQRGTRSEQRRNR